MTIEKVIQKVNVAGSNAEIRREYIGRNTSNEEVDSIITYAMGDKKLSLNRISFKAWDFTNGKKECWEKTQGWVLVEVYSPKIL